MLSEVRNLPNRVLGVYAEGKVTKNDYEKTLVPLLDKAHEKGERVKLLYQIGPDFSGFTAGAAIDDFRIGLKYLSLFEKCAFVSDIDWVRKSVQLTSALIPCPIKTFKSDEFIQATDWLSRSGKKSNLTFELKDSGVLIIHPHGPLLFDDFDRLKKALDPWLKTHKKFDGIVIEVKKFPGWENTASFLHHFNFIKDHHKKIKKVAIAMGGILPEMLSKIANYFVDAEIKLFPYSKKQDAYLWVSSQK